MHTKTLCSKENVTRTKGNLLHSIEVRSTKGIKENEFLSLVTMWIDLEGSILNGISQTEKGIYHKILLICRH